MSEEVEQQKVQRKERKETEAMEKARRKADLDTKEAANKVKFIPLHTVHVLKYKYI